MEGKCKKGTTLESLAGACFMQKKEPMKKSCGLCGQIQREYNSVVLDILSIEIISWISCNKFINAQSKGFGF